VQELQALGSRAARPAAELLDSSSQVAADIEKHGGAKAKAQGGVNGMDYALLAIADILHIR
jgi:hypothetical protein